MNLSATILARSPESAIRERDAGMAAATEHAERASADWSSVALGYLISYARDHQTFVAEEVGEYAASKGLQTAQPKAWGSVILAAAKRGIITRDGYGVSLRRHASPTIRWLSNVYWSAE